MALRQACPRRVELSFKKNDERITSVPGHPPRASTDLTREPSQRSRSGAESWRFGVLVATFHVLRSVIPVLLKRDFIKEFFQGNQFTSIE
jgi:hypothetical protein